MTFESATALVAKIVVAVSAKAEAVATLRNPRDDCSSWLDTRTTFINLIFISTPSFSQFHSELSLRLQTIAIFRPYSLAPPLSTTFLQPFFRLSSRL
jgi:hypothetical protein